MLDTIWTVIDEFPNYSISNFGDVLNESTRRILRQSTTQHGAAKVNIYDCGQQFTRSVTVLVAEAYVEGKTILFDTPIHLDANQLNNRSDNLMWRPRWFAWQYTRQFQKIPPYCFGDPVMEIQERISYKNIYEACITNGLLFKDVWKSITVFNPVNSAWPTGQIFDFCVNRLQSPRK